MKLQGPERVILQLMLRDENKPIRGLELVKRSHGSLKRGTVYVWLTKMEDAGLVASKELPVDPNTRVAPREYWATEAGIEEMEKLTKERFSILDQVVRKMLGEDA